MRSFTSFVLLLALVSGALSSIVVPLNGHCTNRPNKCGPGLSCVGPATLKKCKPLRTLNQRCGVDPYWVCGEGLVCEDQRCRIAQGFTCTETPYQCADGLQCVGTDDYKLCEKPIKLGGQCLIEPWWVCDAGLKCDGNVCKIDQGYECTATPYLCASGLHCVGTDDYKQCEKPIEAGGECLIEPYWVCKNGLTCQHGICRIPKGGNCTYKEGYCLKGLLNCVGPADNKRCEFPLKKGEACTGPYDYCGAGLTCGGLGKARICIDAAKTGEPCRDTNPKLTCDNGLKCVDGFCRS